MDAVPSGEEQLVKMKLVEVYRETVSTELQDHQKRVSEKLGKSGGILAVHGMGSGKSLTAINATQGDSPDIVVPASYEKASKNDGHKPSKTIVMDEPQAIGNADTLKSRSLMDKSLGYEKRDDKEKKDEKKESVVDYYVRMLETGPCQLIGPQSMPVEGVPAPIDLSKMKKKQSQSQEESRDMEMDHQYK